MAAVLLPAGSASATASSATCNPLTSTPIVTGGLSPSNRVWVDGIDANDPLGTSRITVCVTLNNNLFYTGGMAIVFDAGSGVITPPAVNVTSSPTPCGTVRPLWDSVTPNLALMVNPTARAVCIRTGDPTTHADVWTSVQFGAPSVTPGGLPTLEVWKDGGANWGFIDAAACPVEYVLFLTVGGPDTCMTTNKRVYP
jgi:hypothetical protein